MAVDFRHDRRRDVFDNNLSLKFFFDDNSRRRRIFQQQPAEAGGPRVVGLLGLHDRRRPAKIGRFGDALDASLYFLRRSGPLLRRKATQIGQTPRQLGTLGHQLRLLLRKSCRVFPLRFRQPRPDNAAKPTFVGRILQPTILDGQRVNRPVASQHCAVAGENAAARRREQGLLLNRSQGFGPKTRPLAHFQLHDSAENQQQHGRESQQTNPQPPPRIDHRRRRDVAQVELTPVEEHRERIVKEERIAKPQAADSPATAVAGRSLIPNP